MDKPSSKFIFVDQNENQMQWEILSKIIASALVDQFELQSLDRNNKKQKEDVAK